MRSELNVLQDASPFARQRWPQEEAWTLAETFTRLGHAGDLDRLKGLIRQIEGLETLAACPIVAVAGMLNAGKTSVASRFLSDNGRARALRGVLNAEGTQRFVFWLPARWRADPDIWSALEGHLKEVFASDIELLDDDPEIAHAQYRNTHTQADLFSVPLVGTDPNLDDLGFAFLDCPDVQRRHMGTSLTESALQNIRLEVLGRAAQLCSSFLVVATLDGVQDKTLALIFKALSDQAPGIRRILLLNKLRPALPPHEVVQEVDSLKRAHDLEAIFGAWDFDISGHQQWTPKSGQIVGYPTFYQLSASAQENPPQASVEGRMLADLPRLLPRQTLFTEKATSLEVRFKETLRDALRSVQAQIAERVVGVSRAHDCLLLACADVLIDAEQQLRFTLSPEVIRALLLSLERSAPFYVRPFMRLNGRMRSLFDAGREGVRRLFEAMKPADALREQMQRAGQGQRLTADTLNQALKGQDVDHAVEVEDIRAACQRALDRFAQEHRSRLKTETLDEMAEEIWAALPVWRKATTASASIISLIAGLTTVVLIPIDMGSSIIYAASAQEILAAVALSAVVGTTQEGKLRSQLEQQAALPAFADLLALLCDELGLPRDRIDGVSWSIALGDLPRPLVHPPPDQSDQAPLITLEEGAVEELEARL